MMIDFMKFTGRGDQREYLRGPFSAGGKTYVSDGFIAVEIIDNAPPAISIMHGHSLPKLLADAFDGLAETDLSPLPALPAAKPCETCEGTGDMAPCTSAACDDGWVDDDYCPTCNGRGQVHRHKGTIQQPCVACQGRGEVRDIVMVRNAHFDARYLRLIAALPGAAFAEDRLKPGFNPARFRFDGGRGIVMPCFMW